MEFEVLRVDHPYTHEDLRNRKESIGKYIVEELNDLMDGDLPLPHIPTNAGLILNGEKLKPPVATTRCLMA